MVKSAIIYDNRVCDSLPFSCTPTSVSMSVCSRRLSVVEALQTTIFLPEAFVTSRINGFLQGKAVEQQQRWVVDRNISLWSYWYQPGAPAPEVKYGFVGVSFLSLREIVEWHKFSINKTKVLRSASRIFIHNQEYLRGALLFVLL